MFDSKLNIGVDEDLNISYFDDTVGPKNELRRLKDIRGSLLDSSAQGPEVVYSIAMDVGRKQDQADLNKRMLLFGVCAYSKGKVGKEPVRSQGHIHSISASTGSSTPEVYEIWDGEAIIMMQPSADATLEKCFAVHANPGDVVIVPPNWAHCTINGNHNKRMVFGAWCIRDYGFDYKQVRDHHGLAYYPIANEDGSTGWLPNYNYKNVELTYKRSRSYKDDFQIDDEKSIYQQYIENHDKFDFVTQPNRYEKLWENYLP